VRHPIFYGSFDLTIDDKNRLVIPADVRGQINPERDGNAFFLVNGDNEIPWLYTETYYSHLATQYDTDLTPSTELMEYYRATFADASRIEWDKQFRMLIPTRVLAPLAIEKDITLIGVNNHLELWNQQAWKVKREELKKRKAELTSQVQQAKKPLVALPAPLQAQHPS